jgi:hypothetical protein
MVIRYIVRDERRRDCLVAGTCALERRLKETEVLKLSIPLKVLEEKTVGLNVRE